MQKSSKKNTKAKESRTRRSREKYPYLKKELNTKRRRDYLDNTYYIDGVESVDYSSDDGGIRPLNEEERAWLNKFNSEYYGASFSKNDKNNLHQTKASKKKLDKIKKEIKDLKGQIKTIESKKKKDVDKLTELHDKVKKLGETYEYLYPKKSCTDANNARNRCLVNKGKATGTLKFIPWNAHTQNMEDEGWGNGDDGDRTGLVDMMHDLEAIEDLEIDEVFKRNDKDLE